MFELEEHLNYDQEPLVLPAGLRVSKIRHLHFVSHAYSNYARKAWRPLQSMIELRRIDFALRPDLHSALLSYTVCINVLDFMRGLTPEVELHLGSWDELIRRAVEEDEEWATAATLQEYYDLCAPRRGERLQDTCDPALFEKVFRAILRKYGPIEAW